MVVACDLAIAAREATFGLPEAAKGLFPFIALAIVKGALPKVLFDLIYSARLMGSADTGAAETSLDRAERALLAALELANR